MKICIVDDNKTETEDLQNLIMKRYPMYDISCFDSPEELLKTFKKHSYDLIILDIYMKQMSGIDAAHSIREIDKDVALAFYTSSNGHASESYRVNASYYLLKPHTEKDIDLMFDRLDLKDIELKKTIHLPNGTPVVLRDIFYTDYLNHVVYFHCRNGNNLRCYTSQKVIEELLCQYNYFITCSQGIIVNLYEVQELASDHFVLKNNARVPISRRRYKETQQAYLNFKFDLMRKEI